VEKREVKQVVSLLLAQAQEPRNFVRETSGPCMNDEELNHIQVGWEMSCKDSCNHQRAKSLTFVLIEFYQIKSTYQEVVMHELL